MFTRENKNARQEQGVCPPCPLTGSSDFHANGSKKSRALAPTLYSFPSRLAIRERGQFMCCSSVGYGTDSIPHAVFVFSEVGAALRGRPCFIILIPIRIKGKDNIT